MVSTLDCDRLSTWIVLYGFVICYFDVLLVLHFNVLFICVGLSHERLAIEPSDDIVNHSGKSSGFERYKSKDRAIDR